MQKQRDINRIRTLILMQRLYVYLFALKYLQYIYDQSGNLIEEADGNGEVISDYIYLGSTPVGRVDIQWDTVPPVTDMGSNLGVRSCRAVAQTKLQEEL